ncbi:MAG: hypothetical protein AB1941_22835 [Gemmatimonadota bacterium]
MAASESSRAYAHPPFTNEEVFRAFEVILPEAVQEAARGEFPGAPDDFFMGHITTGMLLILCTFSDELAARVIAYSPDLEPQVQRVLEDPEGFIRSIRDEAATDFGAQDQE